METQLELAFSGATSGRFLHFPLQGFHKALNRYPNMTKCSD